AVFGLGQSAVYACLSRVSQHWFPSQARTLLQGWVAVFFGRIGGLSCNLLFGTVLMGMLGVGWRGLLLAFAASGITFAVLFWILFRDRPRDHPWTNAAEVELLAGASSVMVADQYGDVPVSVRDLLNRMR